MLDLIAEHPDRTPYLQLATIGIEDRGPKEDPLPYTVLVLPVEVDAADAFTLAVEAGDPGDAAVVAVEVRLGYSQIVRRTVPAGQPLPTFRIAAPGHGRADIQLTERGRLSIRVGYGDDEADALARPAAREDVLFRVVDGTAEVLLPTAKLRIGHGRPDLAVASAGDADRPPRRSPAGAAGSLTSSRPRSRSATSSATASQASVGRSTGRARARAAGAATTSTSRPRGTTPATRVSTAAATRHLDVATSAADPPPPRGRQRGVGSGPARRGSGEASAGATSRSGLGRTGPRR